MHFLPLQPRTKDYTDLSDEVCILDKNYEGTLIWNYPSEPTIRLPLLPKYKYLGIYINRQLNFKDHLAFLKDKLTFIINSFVSIRKSSKDLKFCYNTWELFIRSNLDYASAYLWYCTDKDRESMRTLYRTTLRKMMFLKDYTRVDLLDELIQYNYRELPNKFKELSEEKFIERCKPDPNWSKLYAKIDFEYRKINTSMLPWIYSPTVNIVFAYQKECKICVNRHLPGIPDTPHHRRQHFSEDPQLHNVDVIQFLVDFIGDMRNSTKYEKNRKTLNNIYNYAIKIASGL